MPRAAPTGTHARDTILWVAPRSPTIGYLFWRESSIARRLVNCNRFYSISRLCTWRPFVIGRCISWFELYSGNVSLFKRFVVHICPWDLTYCAVLFVSFIDNSDLYFSISAICSLYNYYIFSAVGIFVFFNCHFRLARRQRAWHITSTNQNAVAECGCRPNHEQLSGTSSQFHPLGRAIPHAQRSGREARKARSSSESAKPRLCEYFARQCGVGPSAKTAHPLPDQSTIIRMDSSSTGYSRLRSTSPRPDLRQLPQNRLLVCGRPSIASVTCPFCIG